MLFWGHIWRNSLLNKKQIHITKQQKEAWQDPKGESYAWRAQSQTVSVNVSSVDVGKVLTGFSLTTASIASEKKKSCKTYNKSPDSANCLSLSTLPHTSHKAQAEQVQLTLVMFPFHPNVTWPFIFKTPLLSATLLSQKVQIHSYLCLY